jgi:DNA polymerase elongation subunit (family B)
MSKKEFINQATPEDIKLFLEGHDPEKYIVAIELDQTNDWTVDESNRVYTFIDDPKKGKMIKTQKFTPFLWTKSLRGSGFYGDDIEKMRKEAKKYGIFTEKLRTDDNERLEDGFKFIVKSTGTYRDLINFFKRGGLDPWKRKDMIQLIQPIEQFMIQTGKRLFKGCEEYNDIHKLVFDIETTSLDPESGHIFLIGIKDNRGYRQIIDSYNEDGVWSEDTERKMLVKFFEILTERNASVITGYNSENFDWHYILGRMRILNMTTETSKFSKRGDKTTTINSKGVIKTRHPEIPMIRKTASLKLGAELENYEQTVMWGTNILDTLHRVRQAQAVNSNIREAGLKYIAKEAKVERPTRVYVDGGQLGRIWVENKNYNYNPTSGQWYGLENEVKPEPKLFENKKGEMVVIDGYEDKWEIRDGRFLITEYLTDDLLETEQVDDIYTQAGFLTSSLVPTTFGRSITMGTATLWKLLMMAWSYENGLALPDISPKRDFVGGLSRLLHLGFSKKVVKFDYASLYPSIQLTHEVFPVSDVTSAIRAMLLYLYDTRNKYKGLMNEAAAAGNQMLASKYDKKQLPIKILNNSAFGSISAPYIFPWGDIDIGEQITCTGRQYLRTMIKFFMDRGYTPLVLDTDGVNFSSPEDVDTRRYTGKGLHRFVKKDVVYEGNEADVAEYNERFMFGVMGLDIDEVMDSTVNFSRKNYAILKQGGKVKLTGNTIKGKTIPKYIEKFLAKSIRMLLDGKGKEFVDYYYEYLEKIYNKQIPLVDIANKSKVKRSIESYLKRGLDKNGRDLPRQAHMELIIRDKIATSLGDTLYYVNNGTRKSHGDITVSKTKKDPVGGTLKFNAYLITEDEIKKNPNLLGEYNVPKYIEGFNKKVAPLLVVFPLHVREALIIEDPENKQFFTSKELELIGGIATNPEDQDTLEELMTMSDAEVEFWRSKGISPDYMFKDRFQELEEIQ